jgi:pSer/pThr/pTyr-binding forkhead associated (FHA) protein
VTQQPTILLVGLAHPNPLPHIVTTGKGWVLGRSSRCDIVANHPSVSRRHAELVALQDCLQVKDLSSSNGTFVDGQHIEHAQVADGHHVRFGDVAFIVCVNKKVVQDPDSSLPTSCKSRSKSMRVTDHAGRGLSEAQSRVLRCVLGGFAEKEVAARLALSEHTVHSHMKAIFRLFGVHSRSELQARLMPYR